MLEGSKHWSRLLACVWTAGWGMLVAGCGDEVPTCADPPPVTDGTSFIQLSPEDSFANVSLDGEPRGTFYLDGRVRIDPCDAPDCTHTLTELVLYSWAGPDGPELGSMSLCTADPLPIASTMGSVVFPGALEARLELGGTPSRAINPSPDNIRYSPTDDLFAMSLDLLDARGREVYVGISGSIIP